MTGDYLELTSARLRAFENYAHANPVESGIVRHAPTAIERFWARAEAKRSADAAVQRAQGRA